ncbi:hypothetical protein [Shivajiella indica]|uniref:Uncharacterized protein n=1 Tax=Shivajiella indica TaxID=872115 RepID=A0ABW5B848_9BACT
MNKYLKYLLMLTLSGFIACESSLVDDDGDPIDGNGQPYNCSNFAYSDTIFYINAATENKIIPVQNLSGQFSAFPEGLQINPETGEIDINKSETGLKYKVSFTPTSSPETVCEFELIVAGVNYLDKVYILDQSDFLATPVFNANPTAISPCPDDDDDIDDDDIDDNSSCKFDEIGPDDKKLADLGIEINSSTGVIDLKKTVENEAFGEVPQNGSTLDVRMYYSLQDNSLGALNGLDLKIFYYEKLQDVPQSLLDEIEDRKSGILSYTQPFIFENGRFLADNPKTKPRPPYLVIVASLQ